MKLALRLGMTLSQLDENMSASELHLWAAFDEISPIGDERKDIHAAQMSAAVYQSQGAKVEMKDLILQWANDSEEAPADGGEAGEAAMLNFFKSLVNKVEE